MDSPLHSSPARSRQVGGQSRRVKPSQARSAVPRGRGGGGTELAVLGMYLCSERWWAVSWHKHGGKEEAREKGGWLWPASRDERRRTEWMEPGTAGSRCGGGRGEEHVGSTNPRQGSASMHTCHSDMERGRRAREREPRCQNRQHCPEKRPSQDLQDLLGSSPDEKKKKKKKKKAAQSGGGTAEGGISHRHLAAAPMF